MVEQERCELVLCVERVHHVSLVHFVFAMASGIRKSLRPKLSPFVADGEVDRCGDFSDTFPHVVRVPWRFNEIHFIFEREKKNRGV